MPLSLSAAVSTCSNVPVKILMNNAFAEDEEERRFFPVIALHSDSEDLRSFLMHFAPFKLQESKHLLHGPAAHFGVFKVQITEATARQCHAISQRLWVVHAHLHLQT